MSCLVATAAHPWPPCLRLNVNTSMKQSRMLSSLLLVRREADADCSYSSDGCSRCGQLGWVDVQLHKNVAVEEGVKADCISSVTGHGACNGHEGFDGGGGDNCYGTGLSMPKNVTSGHSGAFDDGWQLCAKVLWVRSKPQNT